MKKKEPLYLTPSEKQLVVDAFELLILETRHLAEVIRKSRVLLEEVGYEKYNSTESSAKRDIVDGYIKEKEETLWKLRNKITDNS